MGRVEERYRGDNNDLAASHIDCLQVIGGSVVKRSRVTTAEDGTIMHYVNEVQIARSSTRTSPPEKAPASPSARTDMF